MQLIYAKHLRYFYIIQQSMTKAKPKTQPTIFQQLGRVAERVRSGTETNDDILLMMRHPHLANLIVKFKSKK